MNTKFMVSASISPLFQQVCNAKAKPVQAKMASPFSIRLSARERAFLEQQAGYQPLGAYIRAQLFGEKADKRRVLRKPKIDEQQVARQSTRRREEPCPASSERRKRSCGRT